MVDWTKVRKERDEALARYAAVPEPTENTIEACAAALKAEGFTGMTISGVHYSVDEVVALNRFPLPEWISLLKDWRFVCQEGSRDVG